MYQLKRIQTLPITLEKAWAFFSRPQNLEKITPNYLSFEIITPHENTIYEGQIIAYQIKPLLGISVEWVTEITHVKELNYFIDEQKIGPYRLWHHEHRFKTVLGGVEVSDTITYKMRYGLVGELIHKIKVKNDLEKIFDYRSAKLIEIFGS